jgi:hypothetical protein
MELNFEIVTVALSNLLRHDLQGHHFETIEDVEHYLEWIKEVDAHLTNYQNMVKAKGK